MDDDVEAAPTYRCDGKAPTAYKTSQESWPAYGAYTYRDGESQYSIILILHLHAIMNITDYWPMGKEYSVWNVTIAALQFWTADLETHVLSSAIE